MSVFSDPTTGQETSTTQTTETPTTENWLSQVVSEKGDHWKEPETLAKGYLHAQQRIKELEALQEEAKKNNYAKELLDQLQSKQTTTPSVASTEENKEGQVKENTSQTPDELQSLIEKTLADREQKSISAKNIQEVDTKLTELFGTEAPTVLQKRAKELGMSLTQMEQIASQSPSAFLTLVGGAPEKTTNGSFQGTLNTSAGLQNGSKRNWSFYQKLRKENPREYHDIKTQRAMLEDRKKLGNDFYN